jgi:hypothetical protein
MIPLRKKVEIKIHIIEIDDDHGVVATSRMIESRNDYSNHHLLSLR